MTEIKDFTKPRPVLKFRLDDDVFEAVSAVPARVLIDFARSFSNISLESTVDEQLNAFDMILTTVLQPESLKVFSARMADPERPIELDQVENVIEWLFESYGMRPTQPSGASVIGPSSLESGTSLTESAPDVPLTFKPSPSTAS